MKSKHAPLVKETSRGLYCAAGDFFIDPWQPVKRAIITHAHSDHARRGHASYLTTNPGRHVLQTRMGPEAKIDSVPFGQVLSINGVQVSLHPAGHVLGSAQVRVEHQGEVWVISGDYKLEPDKTCATFEPLTCDTFITESTFGLPIYRWRPQADVFADINDWWRQNKAEGRASILFGYSLGKAQRLLSGLDPAIGPIFCHGSVEQVNEDYRASGVELPATLPVGEKEKGEDWSGAMIVAPPGAADSAWMRRFGDASTATASGWMQVRGMRRRQSVDRGFVLSDHADWPGLLSAVQATGATRILVTHGQVHPLIRWLNEQGLSAAPLKTPYSSDTAPADPT